MSVMNPSGRGYPSGWDLPPGQAAFIRDLRPGIRCKAHSSRTGRSYARSTAGVGSKRYRRDLEGIVHTLQMTAALTVLLL